jgi:peroxiredoxin
VSAPQVGDPAPDATLLDEGERPLRLSELWREAPLLLIFLRHFG